MGQIQNAILNTLGSIQQMAQLYKLTDAYANKLKNLSEKEAKDKYGRFLERNKVDAEILKTPLSEEEKAKYEEEFKDIFTRRENESETAFGNRRKRKGDASGPGLEAQLDNVYGSFSGDLLSDEYKDIVRKRNFVYQKNKELDKQREQTNRAKRKNNTLNKAQEQADTNGNIEKAKNMAKGGNQ